jgi:hypothetical protein
MKGKSHSRGRCNILKANERMQRKKAREQARAKGYDRKAYDGTASEES